MTTSSNQIQRLNTNLNHVFSIRDSADSLSYYQNANLPFMLVIMSNHPGQKDTNALSVFAPGIQSNSPFSDTASIPSPRLMHQHDYFEIMYILSGSMYQLVEGKRYLYTAGSCCILNRNTRHTEETYTEFVCVFFSLSIDYLKNWILNGVNYLFPIENTLSENMIYDFLSRNLEYKHENTKDFLDFVPKISESEQRTLVHNIFEQMIKTMISPYYGATHNIQNLFCQLIGILCNKKYYNAAHVTTKVNMDALLFARIDQLLAEYNGRISNRELSRILNYSSSHLSHIVKQNTGVSLFDYSMRFTMKAAAHMLTYTQKSVSDIIAELRFTNRAHFYKIFHEHYHMTPIEYRNVMSEQSAQ